MKQMAMVVVFILGGCVFSGYSGNAFSSPHTFSGIRNNKASGHGGGIAVIGVGTVYLNGSKDCFRGSTESTLCFGNNTQPTNVNYNQADLDGNGSGNGGGIYASGIDTTVHLINTLVEANAAQSGGGIAIENQATLDMRTEFFENTCWKPSACSQVVNNETAFENSPIRGGGLYATSGAQAFISRTEFTNNKADFGTAIYAFTATEDPIATFVDINGVLIAKNGLDGSGRWKDSDTIRNNNALMNISYSTIADNDAVDTSANIFNTGEVGNLRLFNSIIHNNDGLPVFRGINHDSTDFYECLLLNETESLPIETSLIVGDPHFVDREGGNYHLHHLLSEAIDFCYEDGAIPRYKDIDNDTRGVDGPERPEFLGLYDAGYDESNDLIYKGGFDSRN
ncbi:MAG: hypothetical protein R3E90_06000 [Marinicella sp.]